MLQVINTKIVKPISIWPQQRQLQAGAVKNLSFSLKSGQNQLWMKKYVFLLFPTSITFLVLMVTYQPNLIFLDLMLSALSHSQSPQHSKTYLQSLETKPENHFILWQRWGNLFTSVKKAEILSLLGTKICLKEKLRDSESCIF